MTTPGGTATSAAAFIVTNQRGVRTLPVCYVPGYALMVKLDIGPTPTVLEYALEDQPPEGWTLGTISDSGAWDAPSLRVKWGPFFDATARTLTYVLTPPSDAVDPVTFAGVALTATPLPLAGPWLPLPESPLPPKGL